MFAEEANVFLADVVEMAQAEAQETIQTLSLVKKTPRSTATYRPSPTIGFMMVTPPRQIAMDIVSAQ
jgi:hypothetical protein